MKTHILILSFIVISFVACTEEAQTDTSPEIFIAEKIDTAFLNTSYIARPVKVIENGRSMEVLENGQCPEVQVTGRVNTSAPGTYYLDYDYTDAKGNTSATVTRTVYVVENRAAFLNGNYNAVCTCTAVGANISGSSNTTVTTNNYTATVSSYTLNDHFNLVPLKIGPEYVVPRTYLNGNSITAGFYDQNFVVGSSTSSGTLSPDKNTFTIETTNYQISPPIKYHCKNVFTKQLLEITSKN